MELLTLTTEIIKMFDIKGIHITINNNDIIVILKQLNLNTAIFVCPDLKINIGDMINLSFMSKFGKVDIPLKIEEICKNDLQLIVESSFELEFLNDFFLELNKFLKELLEQKKRKEERILCTQVNLQKLKLINTLLFDYKFKSYKGIIKDISYSGIKILTNKEVLEEKGNLFNFKIKFISPDQNFIFTKCPICRKKLYVFENHEFAEIVFKVNENLKYRQRLDKFFTIEKEEERKRKY